MGPKVPSAAGCCVLGRCVDENGLEIGNDAEATHHWTREGHEGELVIDLTLANRPITKWSLLANDDPATGSDRVVIDWGVEVDSQEEPGHEWVVGWNIIVVTEEDAKVVVKL